MVGMEEFQKQFFSRLALQGMRLFRFFLFFLDMTPQTIGNLFEMEKFAYGIPQ